MIIVVDASGNVVPVASLALRKARHKGNNVWTASQAGVPVTAKFLQTVTHENTVTDEQSVSKFDATTIVSEFSKDNFVTAIRAVTSYLASMTVTRDAFWEVTKEVTASMHGASQVFTVTNELGVSKEVTTIATAINNLGVTKEVTVVRYGDVIMEVSHYPYWTRGVAETISIQYYWHVGGVIQDKLNRTPGEALVLTLTSSATGDTLSPGTISTAGWVDGGKEEATCTLSTGTGEGAQVIKISDPEYPALDVEITVYLGGTGTTRSADANYVYTGIEGDGDVNIDDWDVGASVMFEAVQNDTQDSFDADTTLNSTVEYNAYYWMRDRYTYAAMMCDMRGGYARIPLVAGDEIGLLATALTISVRTVLDSNRTGAGQWHKWASRFTLKVFFSESATSFGSGAALRAMTPDISVNMETVQSQAVAQGGGADAYRDVTLDFPKTVIENMVGSTLYAWVVIEPNRNIPYATDFKTAEGGYATLGTAYMIVRDLRVRLHK